MWCHGPVLRRRAGAAPGRASLHRDHSLRAESRPAWSVPGRLVVLGAPADGSVSRAELTTVPSPQEGVCAQRADARQVLRVLPGAWRALKTREPRSRSCPIHCLHVCPRHAWLLRAGLARAPASLRPGTAIPLFLGQAGGRHRKKPVCSGVGPRITLAALG